MYDTPEMPEIEVSEMDTIPPHVVTFNRGVINRVEEQIDLYWEERVTALLINIDRKLRIERSLESLVSYSKVLCDKLLSRLHPFLKTRLPLAKAELHPGRHWVWD